MRQRYTIDDEETRLSFDTFRAYVDKHWMDARQAYVETYQQATRVASAATTREIEASVAELNTGMYLDSRRIARAVRTDGAYLIEDSQEALVSVWIAGGEVVVRVHRQLLQP